MVINIRIQESIFNLDEEQKQLINVSGDAGALVVFQGMVRVHDGDKVLTALFLEHMADVTESEIKRIVILAMERWKITGCSVIHRVGRLLANEPIVLVAVTARHRLDAFAAAEFIMDYLKTEAPFWKKEFFADGTACWVEAKQSDIQQKERWFSSE